MTNHLHWRSLRSAARFAIRVAEHRFQELGGSTSHFGSTTSVKRFNDCLRLLRDFEFGSVSEAEFLAENKRLQTSAYLANGRLPTPWTEDLSWAQDVLDRCVQEIEQGVDLTDPFVGESDREREIEIDCRWLDLAGSEAARGAAFDAFCAAWIVGEFHVAVEIAARYREGDA